MIADDSKRFSSEKQMGSGQKSGCMNIGRSITALMCASLITLVGCSGGSGGGDDGSDDPVSPQINASGSSVQGYAVKGPLKNATASLYSIDLNAPDLKNTLLKTGATDDTGKIINLEVPALIAGPFLLEVTGGKELDGTDPVIPTLRTIVRNDQLAGAARTSIVVTPLTTLVTEMARASAVRKNNTESGTVTAASFFTTSNGGEMGAQAAVVKTALGLGLLNGINIFTDAPVITGSNDAAAALKHRTVIEVNAALFKQILTEVGTGDANAVFAAIAQDFSDGALDGSNGGQPLSALSGHIDEITDILSQSPSELMDLPVPGAAGKTIADLNTLIAQQAGAETVPTPLTITTSTVVAADSDGDGRIDTRDKFPKNPEEWADTDGDCALPPPLGRGYDADMYLNVTSGNDACGDNHDLRPTDETIQTACQLPGADPAKPVASAGINKTRLFKEGDFEDEARRTIYLAGKNSCDPNGDTLQYEWTVVSVPTTGSGPDAKDLLGKTDKGEGSAITRENMLSSYSVAEPSFVGNFAGVYKFALRVSDDAGATWSTPSEVTVTIDKGYFIDFDGKALFLSSLAALLLLAVPAKLRKKNIKN